MIKYTEKQTAELVSLWLQYLENQSSTAIKDPSVPQDMAVKLLSVHFNKPVKSIVSKLSTEKVYDKVGYLTKKGTKPESKFSMLCDIENMLGDKFIQLDKVPKPTLEKLRASIKRVVVNS